MKNYNTTITILIGLLQTYNLLPIEAGKSIIETPSAAKQSHQVETTIHTTPRAIEAMRAENNTTISHEQIEQQPTPSTRSENTNHSADTAANKNMDSISLDQSTNSQTTQKQIIAATKSTSINSSQMTMTELIPLLTKYINKIDGLTNDNIQTLQRLFKSSYTQTYHPNSFDPISMGRFNKTKDYVSLLQNTKFRNIPPFMLEKYVDLVLTATKSGQKGWIGTWQTLTPADVLNYKPGYPEKDSDHGTLISTPSDLQTLYHNMQAIEKVEEFNKIERQNIENSKKIEQLKHENIDRANKQRAVRTITKKITGKKSIPEIETENIILNSFTFMGYPTNKAIKDLMIQQYFPNKNSNDVTVTSARGGAFTSAIYSVSVQNKPVFFLKISHPTDSDKRLVEMQQNLIGRIGMQSRYESALNSDLQKNLPIITWMEKLYTYKDQEGNNRTIEVMHAAKGKAIYDTIQPISYNITPQLIACSAAGKALGSFQQFFMNYVDPHDPSTWQTVIHGDFHWANIFFDASTSQAYFIDNESMRSKNSNAMGFDFLTFENSIFNYPALQKSFLDGYFETFPADKRSVLAQYLKKNSELNPKLFDPYITPSTQPEAKITQQNRTSTLGQQKITAPAGRVRAESL